MEIPNTSGIKFEQQKVQLWETDLVTPLLTSLRIAEGTAEYLKYINAPSSSYTEDHNPSGLPLFRPSFPIQDGMLKCSFCDTTFTNREEQVAHYALDWHRFNIKRVMEGLNSITQEEFENPIDLTDDEIEDETLLGSDIEENDKCHGDFEEHASIAKKPWIFFENSDGLIISLFRNILLPKKTDAPSEGGFIQRVMASPRKLYWVILIAGGGHFAAAVFRGAEAILHKTFHSYTVRAKQGGSQSSYDNKSGNVHPKSAGASLRRYNEKAHLQHVQELLEEWKPHFAECDLIFYRCPLSQRGILFDSHPRALKKGDFRIRTIPFTTKKPTFKEVKRVHHLLSQIVVYAKEDYLTKQNLNTSQSKSSPKIKESPIKKKKCKKRNQLPKVSMSDKASADTQGIANLYLLDEEESDEEDELVIGFQALSTNELKEFSSSLEEEAKKDPANDLKVVHNAIYTACRTGDLYKLQSIYDFHKSRDITSVPDCLSVELTSAILSSKEELEGIQFLKIGASEKTLLHIAAENQQKKLLWWLLDVGCDPSVGDGRNRTAYDAASSKTIKDHFRKYMAEFPDKYDYTEARIPVPLTKEQEVQVKLKIAEKKKQQRKNKQEKEKQKKNEIAVKKAEEEEKQKFLQLSDREKRALAAERRILSQQKEMTGSISAVQRCFQCAKDITREIPFEYSTFKFCSTKCVREHRSKNKSS